MEDKRIQSILQDALEEEIPSSEIKLWPAIRASLVAGKNMSVQQGEKMNGTQPRHLQRVALTILMMAVLASLAFITPQGRALAQDILQFFRRAESNTFPLSASQIPSDEIDASTPTAAPPAPLISVSDAELQAGFDAAELASIPQGFNYLGTRVYGNAIQLEYEAQGGGGNLFITQSKEGFLQSDWDKVPADAITSVTIGGSDAEFAQGTFVVYPGETSATWNADAPVLRLRWVKDGIWYEIAKFGDVERIEYLDRERMIALAESLTNNPFPLEVGEVEPQITFDILEPVHLPEGMTFLGASYDPVSRMVSLSYGYSEMDRSILISQQPVNTTESCELCVLVGASAEVERVQTRGTDGEYVIGVWKADDAGNWIWENEPYLQRIRWQENNMAYEILYMGSPEQVTKEDLLVIAESMK